jgi:hypothetical protein
MNNIYKKQYITASLANNNKHKKNIAEILLLIFAWLTLASLIYLVYMKIDTIILHFH